MKNLLRKFVPSFLVSSYHFLLAFAGAVYYGFPSGKLKVIGVTGTNGKTTTVFLISQVLEKAGYKAASFSSVKFKIGEKEQSNILKMTMPGRFKLQKLLGEAVKEGCQYAVLEVTSEGIKQHRHRFISFNTAVFTNLTPEHIEAHGGFDNYRAAKGKLFQAAKNIHVVNIDDENAEYFLQFPAKEKITYGLAKGDASNENLQLKLQLMGQFNIYNALAAVCVGLSQRISLDICREAVERFKQIPGRMELVISQPFKVFIDYAFTPSALEQVYQTLKPKICVLGACGGGRDKWKRKILGQIAAQYCQEVIITNEDPYDEDPHHILSMIKSGILNSQFPISNFHEILDRRQAIQKSLQLAKPGDVVVMTGKGSENSIAVKGGKKIPWDEKKVVREEYEKIRSLGA